MIEFFICFGRLVEVNDLQAAQEMYWAAKEYATAIQILGERLAFLSVFLSARFFVFFNLVRRQQLARHSHRKVSLAQQTRAQGADSSGRRLSSGMFPSWALNLTVSGPSFSLLIFFPIFFPLLLFPPLFSSFLPFPFFPLVPLLFILPRPGWSPRLRQRGVPEAGRRARPAASARGAAPVGRGVRAHRPAARSRRQPAPAARRVARRQRPLRRGARGAQSLPVGRRCVSVSCVSV